MRALLALCLLTAIAFGAPITKRILLHEPNGTATNVTVEGGSNVGIARTWTCVFIDAKDNVISTDCVLIRIDKTRTTCKTNATDTVLHDGVRVRLSPPAPPH